MQEDKMPLREALNLRIDERLAAEIERIASLRGESVSETARLLLSYGAEVERRLEAQRLMQHYEREYTSETAGRIQIKAEFVPYTWQEVVEMREILEAGGSIPQSPPVWEDLVP